MKTNSEKDVSNGDPDVTGIDLQIDKSIDKICEVSNSTSNNIRSVWYIIIIASTLSFAEFWNTQPFNSSDKSLESIQEFIGLMENSLLPGSQYYNADTTNTKRQLEFLKYKLNLLHSNSVTNFLTVKIPILGNAFHINDLAIFAGFSFIVLLLILKYILMRKIRNLKIAFIAITKRYTDEADENLFKDYLDKSKNRINILKAINSSRRKYHYNVLVMNEIYNDPGGIADERSFIGHLNDKVIYIPLVISSLLFINHIATIIFFGWGFDRASDFFLIIINIIYVWVILKLSKKCDNQSKELERLYVVFKETITDLRKDENKS